MLSGQDLLNYIGKHLTVRFEVISNVKRPCESKITLYNNGDEPIKDDCWSIYSYHLCEVDTENVTIEVQHVVGGLFKYTPTSEFTELLPRESLEIVLTADEPTASRSMVFPNWYVAKQGLEPRLIESTVDETLSFVSKFDDPQKWKKYATDESNPLSLEERFKKYVVEDLGEAKIPIIPTPLEAKLQYQEKVIISNRKWVVVNSNHVFANEAEMLAQYLEVDLVSSDSEAGDKHCIKLDCEFVNNKYSSCDSYKVEVDSKIPEIAMSAKTSSGMFYAVQSVKSLMEDQLPHTQKSLPTGILIDAPRFAYRGFHIDVARNFVKADEIMKLIRVMSAYKLNKLHFHLTDDEAWRLEIKDLPELNEIGAKHDHNLAKDGLAIEPTLGSGPCMNSPANGYYTTEDYQNILRCAKDHHVQVIPEIDMPGHSYAAIVAMTARYKKLRSEGKVAAAEEYLLIDLDDQSMYSSDQKFSNNTMNPFLKGTRNFVTKIVESLIELHEPIQPLKIFHVGGDEVPVGAWGGSTICNDYLKENELDHKEPDCDDDTICQNGDEALSRRNTATIQEYFTKFVETLCNEKKLQLAVWNDGIPDPTEPQNGDTPRLVHAWRISRKNERYNPNILANSGYQVVISSATHTYFDHPYEPDPEEGGLTWCVRQMDTKTVFGMKPYDMYKCQGKQFSDIDHEKLRNKSAIQGIQSHVWGELIRSENKLEYMLFPRLLAIAERGWHQALWEECDESTEFEKDWCNFANTLGYKELRRLDEMGIHFRIPPPGLTRQGDNIYIGGAFPNLKFQYSVAGEENWKDVPASMSIHGLMENQKYEFVTCAGPRRSRAVLY